MANALSKAAKSMQQRKSSHVDSVAGAGRYSSAIERASKRMQDEGAPARKAKADFDAEQARVLRDMQSFSASMKPRHQQDLGAARKSATSTDILGGQMSAESLVNRLLAALQHQEQWSTTAQKPAWTQQQKDQMSHKGASFGTGGEEFFINREDNRAFDAASGWHADPSAPRLTAGIPQSVRLPFYIGRGGESAQDSKEIERYGRVRSAQERSLDPYTEGTPEQQAYNSLKDTLTAGIGGGIGSIGNALGKFYSLRELLTNGPRQSRGVVSTFGGINAKTAKAEAFALAKTMKEAGHTDESILQATAKLGQPIHTGFPDGMPRFEIDDSGAVLNQAEIPDRITRLELANIYLQSKGVPAGRDIGSSSALVSDELKRDAYSFAERESKNMLAPSSTMGRVLSHEKAFDAYPDISPRPVSRGEDPSMRGSYSPSTDSFELGRGLINDAPNTQQSTALHELQHAIQQREGFAKGGSPSTLDPLRLKQQANAITAKIDALSKRIYATDAPQLSGRLLAERDDFFVARQSLLKAARMAETDADQAYRYLAGEAEARLVQLRMGLTEAQRLAEPIKHGSKYGFDVPEADQIVRRDGGIAESRSGEYDQYLKNILNKGDPLIDGLPTSQYRSPAAFVTNPDTGVRGPQLQDTAGYKSNQPPSDKVGERTVYSGGAYTPKGREMTPGEHKQGMVMGVPYGLMSFKATDLPLPPVPEMRAYDIPVGSLVAQPHYDRMATDRVIEAINDSEGALRIFNENVTAHGGHRFGNSLNHVGPEGQRLIAANADPAAQSLARRIRNAGEEGRDIYSIPVPTSHSGTDFARPTADALLEMVQVGEMSKKNIKVIDKMMESHPKMQTKNRGKWPGILDPEARKLIDTNGEVRLAFSEVMDKKEVSSMRGAPDMPSIRNALVDDDWRSANILPGWGGATVGKFNPEGVTHDLRMSNPDLTYTTGIEGTVEGKFPFPVPQQLLSPEEHMNNLLAPNSLPLRDKMRGDRAHRSASLKTLGLPKEGLTSPGQRVTPLWQDVIEAFFEQQAKKKAAGVTY